MAGKMMKGGCASGKKMPKHAAPKSTKPKGKSRPKGTTNQYPIS